MLIRASSGNGGGGGMTIETKQAIVNTPVTFDNFENGTVAYYSTANAAPVAMLVIKDGVVDTTNSYYGNSGYYMFSYDTTTHTVSFTLSYAYSRKDVVAISYAWYIGALNQSFDGVSGDTSFGRITLATTTNGFTIRFTATAASIWQNNDAYYIATA